MAHQLTRGALAALFKEVKVIDPVLQLLKTMAIPCGGAKTLHRVLISDETHFTSDVVIATNLNNKISVGDLTNHSIFRLKEYMTKRITSSTGEEKVLLIINDVETLKSGNEVGGPIGSPKNLKGSPSASSAPTSGKSILEPAPTGSPSASSAPTSGKSILEPAQTGSTSASPAPTSGKSILKPASSVSADDVDNDNDGDGGAASAGAATDAGAATAVDSAGDDAAVAADAGAAVDSAGDDDAVAADDDESDEEFEVLTQNKFQQTTTASSVELTSVVAPSDEAGSSEGSRATGSCRESSSKCLSVNELKPNLRISPIDSINPYRRKWAIKGRVTSKSEIREWSKKYTAGKFFSFDILDASGEIRVTAFNEMCDKFFDVIQIDKVFVLRGGTVLLNDRKYAPKKNSFVIHLTENSAIQPASEDDDDAPPISYNFKRICDIDGIKGNELIDVIGVVTRASRVKSFVSKSTNNELMKKELTILDDSNSAIDVILWGQSATSIEVQIDSIIAVRGGTVSELSTGKSVNVSPNSLFVIDPNIPRAHKIRGWYTREFDKRSDVKYLSNKTS